MRPSLSDRGTIAFRWCSQEMKGFTRYPRTLTDDHHMPAELRAMFALPLSLWTKIPLVLQPFLTLINAKNENSKLSQCWAAYRRIPSAAVPSALSDTAAMCHEWVDSPGLLANHPSLIEPSASLLLRCATGRYGVGSGCLLLHLIYHFERGCLLKLEICQNPNPENRVSIHHCSQSGISLLTW